MTKVARLYHEHGVRQHDIADQLHISQARVSRLLKQAVETGIVRTTVVVPSGVQTELEEAIEQGYGIREAVVVETLDDTDEGLVRDLGRATAAYLETTLTGGDVVGLSSWSATLLAAVDSLRPLPRVGASRAVQLFGGVGNPSAEAHAAHLTRRFADVTGAEPLFLLAPGIAASQQARDALLEDRFVIEALAALSDVTLALVGIGTLQPSPLLQRSGNIFSDDELAALGARGAVGDICLRFFDAQGQRVESQHDERIIGATLEQLRGVDRCVGIAGGERKYAAIRAALVGHNINVIITDRRTAERLVADRPAEAQTGKG